MAEEIIVNATQAALATGNETTAAWTVAESVNAPSDAELRAIADLDKVAVMQTGATSVEKAAVAKCLIDNLSSVLDLSTAVKREAIRRKRSLADMEAIFDAIFNAVEAK